MTVSRALTPAELRPTVVAWSQRVRKVGGIASFAFPVIVFSIGGPPSCRTVVSEVCSSSWFSFGVMTELASLPTVEQLDNALAAAPREERQELDQARLRDQELADRVAQALSAQRTDGIPAAS
jgi:hypothetical protein